MAQDNVPRVPVAAPQSAGDSARSALQSPFSEAARLQARRGGAGNLFSGVATAMTEVRDVLRKNDLERDRIKSVTAETAYLTEADDKIAKLDPLSKDYHDRVREIYEGGKSKALETADLRTPEAKTELEARLTRVAAAGSLTANVARRGALEGEAVRVRDQSADRVLAQIRKDPDGYDNYVGQFGADAKRLNDGITPEKTRQFAQKFADAAITAKIEGYAEKGNFAAARKTLDAEAGNLTPDQNRSIRNLIEGRESKARADGERYSAQYASQAEAEIRAGGKIGPDGKVIPGSKPPDLATLEADKQAGRFALNPSAYVRLRTLVLAVDGENLANSEKGRIAVEAYNSGTLDTKNQDMVNRAYNEVVVGEIGRRVDPTTPLEGRAMQMTEAFIAKTGAVPDNIRIRIENAERLGTDDKAQAALAQAAYLADRVQQANPNANIKYGDRLTAVMTAVKNDGLSYEDAARQVTGQWPTDQKVIADRKENFKVLDKDTNWTKDIGSEFSRSWTQIVGDALIPGRTNYGAVQVPDTIGNEAKRLAEHNFLRTGDHVRAKQMTLEQIKRDYGVTFVGGQPTVMKYPPERYLPPEVAKALPPQGARAVIDEQILTGLKAAGYKPPETGGAAYRLVSDDRTEAEVRSGRPPSYRLQVLDPTGHVYLDAKSAQGGPARYTVPTAEEVKASTVWQKVQRDAAAAEADRRIKEQRDEEMRRRETRPPRTGGGLSPAPKAQ